MGCGCNKGKDPLAGLTAAELNDPNGQWVVQVPGGTEQRFSDYGAARRFAKRVGSAVSQA